MRLGDVQLAFPVLVLAVAVLAVLGAQPRPTSSSCSA